MELTRSREYILRYGLLIGTAATSTLWKGFYNQFLEQFDIPEKWGYGYPLILLTALLVGPDLYRAGRGIWVAATTKFRFSELLQVIDSSTRYGGSPIFYIDRNDQDFYQITYETILFRLRLLVRRFMFREFPVVYYNITAKPFLNWIDYFYLRLLADLREQIGARIIVALHFDEEIYTEGFFTNVVRERYTNLFEQAEKMTSKVAGEDVAIIDERWFLKRGSKGARRFAEYFFGVLIAKINELAVQLERHELSFDDFYRTETNLISILSTILLARQYGHIFVLDYEGSFQVWEQTPFSELKRQHRVFFIKCRKIRGPHGERLPAWSPEDGVNLTDDTDTIRRKIEDLDQVVVDAMSETFGIARPGVRPEESRADLFEEIKRIKSDTGLQ